MNVRKKGKERGKEEGIRTWKVQERLREEKNGRRRSNEKGGKGIFGSCFSFSFFLIFIIIIFFFFLDWH